MQDDEQGALAAYVQALEIDPKYLRALDRLGKLQMQRKLIIMRLAQPAARF